MEARSVSTRSSPIFLACKCVSKPHRRQQDSYDSDSSDGGSGVPSQSTIPGLPPFNDCCVEAEYHFCYLRDSGVYVHESCCLDVQGHPLTYVGRRRFWYGLLTKYGS